MHKHLSKFAYSNPIVQKELLAGNRLDSGDTPIMWWCRTHCTLWWSVKQKTTKYYRSRSRTEFVVFGEKLTDIESCNNKLLDPKQHCNYEKTDVSYLEPEFRPKCVRYAIDLHPVNYALSEKRE